jgi:hypothetical protein
MNNEFQERRRDERFSCDPPEFFNVQFKLGKNPGEELVWELNVLDCSRQGLGLLVTDIDYDLLKMLKPGDVIKDITFYGASTMIRVDATIKHIRQIAKGPYKGQHLIGVESSDIITNCMPGDWEASESPTVAS